MGDYSDTVRSSKEEQTVDCPNPALSPPLGGLGGTIVPGLRPYQEEAVRAVLGDFERFRSTLLVACTGSGKTQMFVTAADRYQSAHGNCRTLVLAHRRELIDQAKIRFEQLTDLSVGIEMADQSVLNGPLPDVVIASVQTLQNRLTKFGPADFGLVIQDECHHAPSKVFARPIDYFSQAKLLGVTATPDRLDEQKLGKIFEHVAYEYNLEQAIRGGWLVPILQKRIKVEGLDFRVVRVVAGDFNQGDLEALMIENLHMVTVPTLREAGSRQTLIFCVTVNHATLLAELLNRYQPGCAKSLYGGSEADERAQVLKEFADGRIQFLTNVGLFTEGIDIPSVSCVAMARPTRSRALYSQAIGRGTRLHPGKTDLLILDFAGNAGRHKLVSAIDIFAPEQDPAIATEISRLLGEDGTINVLDARDQAAENVESDRKEAELRRIEQLRRTQEEMERTKGYRPQIRYRQETIAAFEWGGVQLELDEFSENSEPLTADMIIFLKKHGVNSTGLNLLQAQTLRSAIRLRARLGLCTHKQTLTLGKYGLDARTWPYERASFAIDQIVASNWSPTRELIDALRENWSEDLRDMVGVLNGKIISIENAFSDGANAEPTDEEISL